MTGEESCPFWNTEWGRKCCCLVKWRPISGFNTSPKDSSGVIVTTYNEGRGQQGCLAEDQTAAWNRYINRSHDGGLNRKLFFFFFKKGWKGGMEGWQRKHVTVLKIKICWYLKYINCGFIHLVSGTGWYTLNNNSCIRFSVTYLDSFNDFASFRWG